MKRLKNLLPKKLSRYHYIAFFAFVLVAGFIGSTEFAGALLTEIMNGFLQAVAWLMIAFANLCIGATIFFLRFFISIAAYNNYIDVDVVQLGWIMVRDVANMFFVVALLVIAFGTILGIEEYEWKKNLVKLILAAILINFSNLIAQAIIDVAHVFTITFLNAIAATAGGNLINMFKLDQITSMVGQTDVTENFQIQIVAGAIAAVIFAILSAVAMGSYTFVMMARVVVLWGLIILAPLAYILGVLPKTKSYSDRWWSEFSKHVIVAPVMVFFLWLSFATLGNGQIAAQIQDGQNEQFRLNQDNYSHEGIKQYDNPTLSLSKVTTWESMASFFIAIGFMYYGLKVTQETGATGAGAVGGALAFGKKVATIASGYAVGRWMVGKGTKMAGTAVGAVGKGAKWAVMHAPGANIADRVERVKKFAERQWLSYEGWKNMVDGTYRKQVWDEKEGKYVEVKKKVQREKLDDNGKVMMKDGKPIMEEFEEYEMEEHKATRLQKLFQRNVKRSVASEKKLEKTKKFVETRKEMMLRTVKGVPTGLFVKSWEKLDATDRYERGRLKNMQERSATKTEQYEALGSLTERSRVRKQFEVGTFRIEEGAEKAERTGGRKRDKTVSEEIQEHKVQAETIQKQIEEGGLRSRQKFMEGKKGKEAVEARMRAELAIKTLGSENKKIEEQARIQMALQDIKIAKETGQKIDKLIKQVKEAGAGAGYEPTDAEVDYARLRDGARFDGKNNEEVKEALKKDKIVDSLVKDKQITSTEANEYKKGGEGLVYRAVAAEKQAHTEAEKLERLTAEKGREYAKSDKGTAEIKEEAELKMETEEHKEAVKELEETAKGELRKKGITEAERIAELPEQQRVAAEKQALKSNIALRYAAQKQKTAEAAAFAGTAEKDLQKAALSFDNVKQSFFREQAQKVGLEAAESFIKKLKDEHLADEYNKAAEKMKSWLSLGADELARKVKEATKNSSDVYVRSLGIAQQSVVAADSSGIRKRQAVDAAQDAFINKARYGTLSPSTALSDYSETKMKSYRRLERGAAARKASEVMATLMHQKKKGETLGIDQEAELFAASSFLQEEAWNDDQWDFVIRQMKRLQSGELKGPEGDQWRTMAENLAKLGWFGNDAKVMDGQVFDAQGNWNNKAVIKKSYGRQQAADLQNLAMTGNDVDLVRVHNLVSKKVDTNSAEVEIAVESAKEQVIQKELGKIQFILNDKEENVSVSGAMSKTVKDAIDVARNTARDEGKTGNELLTAVQQAARRAIENTESMKTELETAAKEAITQTKKTYFQIAEDILRGLSIQGLNTVELLKSRFSQYTDFFQDATKSNKANAIKTGHEELGYNQDFDEDENVYRFQTLNEGRSKMRAERVKYKRQQLINTDQFHSHGELDYETGVIDDFNIDAINVSTGGAQRAHELKDAPERTVKGHVLLHKNEQADVRTRTIDGEKVKVAVLGEGAYRKKMAADGHVSEEDQLKHIMLRALAPLLAGGPKGFALEIQRIFQNVSEKEAQEGKINIEVAGQNFVDIKSVANKIIELLGNNPDEVFRTIGSANLVGRGREILKKMHQVASSKFEADTGEVVVTTE